MATESDRCDPEVFAKGDPLLAADAGGMSSAFFEAWVQAVTRASGQQVDWHYSGGVAQVLYLGDRAAVEKAAREIPCPARIMRWFGPGEGLYRAGVTPTPEGTIAAFYEGGPRSTFIVRDAED